MSSDGRHVGFPPRSRFVLLPPRPRRAARAGLALYEAVEPQQRAALAVGSILARSGLVGLLPTATRAEVDPGWWGSFVADVAEPLVGAVEHLAFRVPGNPRVSAILMDGAGKPLAFTKIVDHPQPALAATAGRQLAAGELVAFRVPATLAEDVHAGVRYRLLEPLPEGPHLPPPHDPQRLWAVVDELRDRLATLPRPPGTPDHYVPCHADFTPRNLRLAGDGSWWLFDWDNLRFGPPLTDELRYWSAAVSYRRRVDVARDARRVLELLRARGSDAEIVEAVRWPDQVRQTYRAVEPRLHEAVGTLAQEDR